MFREALSYPTRPPEGGRSVIAGGIALIAITVCYGIASLDTPYAYLAVVGLFPWLLVRGYYVRVVRTTIGRTRPTPPRFGGLKRLFADGVTAVSIAALYLLPGVVVLGPLAAVQAFELDLSTLTATVPEPAVAGGSALVGLLAVVALMSVFGALYVLPVAIARFAHSGEWRDALKLRTVVDGALTEDYAIAWGVSFVLQAVLLPVSYLLRVLLFGFFLHFLVAIGVRYCYGQGVGTALGLSPVESAYPVAETDGQATEAEPDLTPAFTRTDTVRWGVNPSEDAEPMAKRARFDRRDDGSGAGTETPTESNDAEGETERSELRSAVKRVSDDESGTDR
jgi:hypothetical protein